jgi:hypothetical protein
MSADNWAVCPRCKLNEENAIKALDYRIEKEYGKISIDDFLVLRNEAQQRREGLPLQKATFREDYEIFGAEDGAIEINYSGSCKCCGLSMKFTDYRPMDL